MQPITLIAEKIGSALIDEIRDQIVLQGHNLTGKLKASVEDKQVLTDDGVIIRFMLNEYGIPLNTGVFPSRIPYGTYTGAKVSKYIQGLIRFAKLRFRVTEKEAKNIAFAIANKHINEGMPTRNSYRFSKTGKRTDYIEAAIENNFDLIIKYLGELEAEIIKAF